MIQAQESSDNVLPGIQLSDSMLEAGQKVLNFQFKRMMDYIPGSQLGEDVESIHQMRVAARRLRVAVETFQPLFNDLAPDSIFLPLRQITRDLGKVRDLDVFLLNMQPDPGDPQGPDAFHLASFRQYLNGKRTVCNQEVARFLASEPFVTFCRQFPEHIRDLVLNPGSGLDQETRSVGAGSRKIVLARLGDIRAFEPFLESAGVKELHKLRLKIKGLRYVLELFQEIMKPSQGNVIEKLIALQDHLGALADAEVACQIILGYLDDLDPDRGSQAELDRISSLLKRREGERQDLQTRFPALWQGTMHSGFSSELEQALTLG